LCTEKLKTCLHGVTRSNAGQSLALYVPDAGIKPLDGPGRAL